MKLLSDDFEHNELMDKKFSYRGGNVSPHLKWKDIPSGAKSFAISCNDPDAPVGDWIHWLVHKIPANTTANTQGSETALTILDSLLKDAGQKKISENQIVVILEALASADDVEVVVRFPAVLAICARRGLSLNSQALFSRYWDTSPKRQNLEKLLLASAKIFEFQNQGE